MAENNKLDFLGKIGAKHLIDKIKNILNPSSILDNLKTVDGASSGLDADLLDGTQPNELIVRGLISKALYNTDLNELSAPGFKVYHASGGNICENNPVQKGVGFKLIVFGSINDYALQIAQSSKDNALYKRTLVDGTWKSWERILTEGDSKQIFVDLWKAAEGGHDVSTDLFSLNGINDITYAQAIEIYQSRLEFPNVNGVPMKIRTNMLGKSSLDYFLTSNRGVNLSYLFMNNTAIEVANFTVKKLNTTTQQYTTAGTSLPVKEMVKTFKDCTSLKKILGPLHIGDLTESQMAGAFDGCAALESVLLFRLASNLSLKDCPKLTPASMNYMVTYAVNTSPITITVAENVYAKLNFENISEINTTGYNPNTLWELADPGLHDIPLSADEELPAQGDYIVLKGNRSGSYVRVIAKVTAIAVESAKIIQINTLEGLKSYANQAAEWDSKMDSWATVKEVINSKGNIIIATN